MTGGIRNCSAKEVASSIVRFQPQGVFFPTGTILELASEQKLLDSPFESEIVPNRQMVPGGNARGWKRTIDGPGEIPSFFFKNKTGIWIPCPSLAQFQENFYGNLHNVEEKELLLPYFVFPTVFNYSTVHFQWKRKALRDQ